MADQLTGWNRGTWGQAGWNEAIPVTISHVKNGWNEGAWSDLSWGGIETTVPQAQANVGAATVSADAIVVPTGVEGTSQLGELAPLIEGVEATGQVGEVAITAGASVTLTGVQATSQIGNVFLFQQGVEGTGQVDSVTVTADAVVTVDVSGPGYALSGAIGQVGIQEDINVLVTGVEGSAELDAVTISAAATAPVTADYTARGHVGEVTVTGTAEVDTTGLSATASVGQVIVWGKIVPSPDTSYTPINPGATTNWEEIAA